MRGWRRRLKYFTNIHDIAWKFTIGSITACRSCFFHCSTYKSSSCGEIDVLTMGLESEMRSFRVSKNPWSSTSWAFMSWSFATHTAAVFLTYGSSSFKHFRKGSHKYSAILSTRIQPMVRTARARIRGLGSSQSWWRRRIKAIKLNESRSIWYLILIPLL